LANLISDRIYPKLIPNIEIISWRDLNLLAVQVFPSNNRPHFLKNLGIDKGVYIRVGSSNRLADSSIVAELQRIIHCETFDEQVLSELGSEAIDFRAASDLFSGYRNIAPRDLETLKILSKHQGKLAPTIGGFLLFGKNRSQLFPDAWIQAGRFKGADKSKILDSRSFNSYLPSLVKEAIEFVEKHSSKEYDIQKAQRTEKWSVPIVAIREAIINAVVHADYSQRGAPIRLSIFDDRIEIENPGIIPFGMTLEDMFQGVSKLRNPIVGRIFNELRLIEQWGSGITRIFVSCKQAGLPLPLFEEIGPHFRVTIFLEKAHAPEVPQLDQQILDSLENHIGLSTNEIAHKINRTTRATRTLFNPRYKLDTNT